MATEPSHQFLAVREMDPDFPHSTMIVLAYEQKGISRVQILAENRKESKKHRGCALALVPKKRMFMGADGSGGPGLRRALGKLEERGTGDACGCGSVCRALLPGFRARRRPGFLLAGKRIRATFERLDVAEGWSDV